MSMKEEEAAITFLNMVTKERFEMDCCTSDTVQSTKKYLIEEFGMDDVRMFFPHSKAPYGKMNL